MVQINEVYSSFCIEGVRLQQKLQQCSQFHLLLLRDHDAVCRECECHARVPTAGFAAEGCHSCLGWSTKHGGGALQRGQAGAQGLG